MSFSLNFSDVMAGLNNLSKLTPQMCDRAVGKAGSRVLRDSIMEMPTVPLDEGTLRGSGSVCVMGQSAPVVTGAQFGHAVGTPIQNAGPKPGGDSVAVISFNTPYATYQHEGQRQDGSHKVLEYSEPSSGAKFLEQPMLTNAKRYGQIMAESLQKDLSRA